MKKQSIIDVINDLHYILESADELSPATRSRLAQSKEKLSEGIAGSGEEILDAETIQQAIQVLLIIWEIMKQ